jgi:histidine ammonia-lyase
MRLDGGPVTLAQAVAVARGEALGVADWSRLDAARAWLAAHVKEGAGGAPLYGVTTGFGSSRDVRLRPGEIEEAQRNLVRSHAVGLALRPEDWFEEDVVRVAALLRANAFLQGRSGVRREIVEAMLGLLNAGITPRVPLRGSVGASGDLGPLAHFALVLIGEGEAILEGRVVPGAEALRAAGLEPLRLEAKEGLALINGTSFSCALLALALHEAHALARIADAACALAFEALGGRTSALDPRVHASRRQAGQADAAASIAALLEGSRRADRSDDPQDNYALRCAPQVHGASRDALAHATLACEAEMGAVTDNPLLFVLPGDGEPAAISAGNFHGQPVAVAADLACIAAAELASIAERRLAMLVNPQFSRGLPAHLTPRPGVQSGLMIAQYSAAALVSENKTLAHPASVDSIPTGNGAEDHVPMSTWAARKARQVVRNAAQVVALELLAAAQAVEWRVVTGEPHAGRPASAPTEAEIARFSSLRVEDVAAELGRGTAPVYRAVRGICPRVVDDRSTAGEAVALAHAVLDGTLAALDGTLAVLDGKLAAFTADTPSAAAVRPIRRLRWE